MRFTTTIALFIFSLISLTAQSTGFNRIYEDAANCEPTRLEIIDEEYHVFCNCPDEEYILITNHQGLQESFGPNAFNDCEVWGNGNINTVAYFNVGKNEKLYLAQSSANSIELTRFFGNSCSEVIEQNTSYLFDADQEVKAVDVAARRGSQGGIFIAAYEYLGETPGAVPGPHSYRLWIIKTDFQGNEIWRYQSPLDIYSVSLDTEPEMWIDQTSHIGGAMVQFQVPNNSYPYFATTDDNGDHLYGGIIRESISHPLTETQNFSLDGGRFYIEFTAGGGHSYRSINKINPYPNLGVSLAGHYGLDGNGTYTVTQAGGTITAARGYYDGMDVRRYTGFGEYSFTKNYLDLPIPTLLREAENGEALLLKSMDNAGLWILKTCYPDSEPMSESMDLKINAYIPEAIVPVAGKGIGTLYHPGYSPGEVVIYDAEILVSWHLSNDDQLDSSDLLLDQQDFDYILPHHDEAYHFFNGMTLPAELPTGDYYLIVHNDHAEEWIEENEVNNYIAIPFKVYEESDSVITTSFNHQICAGDSFNNIILFEDTVMIDTISLTNGGEYILYDSIVINEVVVLQNINTKVDTVLEVGSIYNNMIVETDTMYTETFVAANGCDSIVTTSIHIVTDVDKLNQGPYQFSIFPNPNSGHFILNFTLPESAAIHFHLMNVQGQKFDLGIPRKHFPTGSNELQMRLGEISSGVYFLGAEWNDQVQWLKVVKI